MSYLKSPLLIFFCKWMFVRTKKVLENSLKKGMSWPVGTMIDYMKVYDYSMKSRPQWKLVTDYSTTNRKSERFGRSVSRFIWVHTSFKHQFVNCSRNSPQVQSKRPKLQPKLVRSLYCLYCIQGKIAPVLYSPFSPSDLRANKKWANWVIYKWLYKKIGELANSRLGVSVSDLYRAKIRLGECKVYSNVGSMVCWLIGQLEPFLHQFANQSKGQWK